MSTRTTRADLELALLRLGKAKGWTVLVTSKKAIAALERYGVLMIDGFDMDNGTWAYLDHNPHNGGWCVELNGGTRTLAGGWPSADRQPARSMLHSIRFALDVLGSTDE